MVVGYQHRQWSWPATAGQPASKRRQFWYPVDCLITTLHGHRQPRLTGCRLDTAAGPLDSCGIAGRGHEQIVRLGWQPYQLPLGHRLHDPVNDVTRIIGLPEIDNCRRHVGRLVTAEAGEERPAIRQRATTRTLSEATVASQASQAGQLSPPHKRTVPEPKVFSCGGRGHFSPCGRRLRLGISPRLPPVAVGPRLLPASIKFPLVCTRCPAPTHKRPMTPAAAW